jgi:hypothetical protein
MSNMNNLDSNNKTNFDYIDLEGITDRSFRNA